MLSCFMVDRYLNQIFQVHAAEGKHRRCISIIAEMEVSIFAIVPSLLHHVVLHTASIRTSKEHSCSYSIIQLGLVFSVVSPLHLSCSLTCHRQAILGLMQQHMELCCKLVHCLLMFHHHMTGRSVLLRPCRYCAIFCCK